MKLVGLMSSGIDSPVACYLMSRNVEEIIIIHGDLSPYSDKGELEIFLEIVKHLNKILTCPIKVYIIPHGKSIEEYKKNCNNKYTCIFCKRMLLRYAGQIANKENAKAIFTGDSLGQVASQTLQNIQVVDQAVKIPILRPLIGYDKEEIIQIAKKIETYNLSIKSLDRCKAVPAKPSTKAKLEQILEQEKKLDITNLVVKTINVTKIVKS